MNGPRTQSMTQFSAITMAPCRTNNSFRLAPKTSLHSSKQTRNQGNLLISFSSSSSAIPSSPDPTPSPPPSPTPTPTPQPPIISDTDDDPPPHAQFLGFSFSFENLVYHIQILYFAVLFLSILSGNRHLTNLASFANFVTAMFLASAMFTGYSATRWLADVREHLADVNRRRKDFRALLRYAWSAVFWSGFCLWYAVPPLTAPTIIQWTGIAGAICCLYGIALAGSSALMIGSWSFLGPPATPRRLVTGGPYALLRHPQALGNFLAVIGFSLAGGSVVAAAAFALSFALYTYTTVPKEERLLEAAFGAKYRHYCEKTPPFAWALVMLCILEAVLIWRYGVQGSMSVVPTLRSPAAGIIV